MIRKTPIVGVERVHQTYRVLIRDLRLPKSIVVPFVLRLSGTNLSEVSKRAMITPDYLTKVISGNIKTVRPNVRSALIEELGFDIFEQDQYL